MSAVKATLASGSDGAIPTPYGTYAVLTLVILRALHSRAAFFVQHASVKLGFAKTRRGVAERVTLLHPVALRIVTAQLSRSPLKQSCMCT